MIPSDLYDPDQVDRHARAVELEHLDTPPGDFLRRAQLRAFPPEADLSTRVLAKADRPVLKYSGGESELASHPEESLRAAFEFVQDRTNWKYPIRAKFTVAPARADAVQSLLSDAIPYYTTTVPGFCYDARNWILDVVAEGYYAGGEDLQ